MSDFTMRAKIAKINVEQHLCFGWGYVTEKADGEQVIDNSGEYVLTEDLELASYDYVASYRLSSHMHTTFETADGQPLAVLVEAVVTTREKQAAWGLPEGSMPVGLWLGYRILDEDLWQAIKSGEVEAFSIGGSAMKEPDAPIAEA